MQEAQALCKKQGTNSTAVTMEASPVQAGHLHP